MFAVIVDADVFVAVAVADAVRVLAAERVDVPVADCVCVRVLARDAAGAAVKDTVDATERAAARETVCVGDTRCERDAAPVGGVVRVGTAERVALDVADDVRVALELAVLVADTAFDLLDDGERELHSELVPLTRAVPDARADGRALRVGVAVAELDAVEDAVRNAERVVVAVRVPFTADAVGAIEARDVRVALAVAEDVPVALAVAELVLVELAVRVP